MLKMLQAENSGDYIKVFLSLSSNHPEELHKTSNKMSIYTVYTVYVT